MRTLNLSLLAGLAFLWGCAGSGSPRSEGPRPNRYLITQEQFQAQAPGTALDLVERLHREWLMGRSGTLRTDTGRNSPYVFVDGRPFGPVETLTQFGSENIEVIRFIPAADATTRYGTGFPAGIIEIITKKD